MADKILILTDGKAGHENQSKAFARALGPEFDIVRVRYRSPIAKAASYLLDRMGVRTGRLFELDGKPRAGEYAAVVGTGSGVFYAAKVLAGRLGVKCGVVLYPRGYDLSGFDCVLAPSFDRPCRRANVIEVPANLVAADEGFYAAGTTAFRERHTCGDRPAVALIVGGPNSRASLDAGWLKGEVERIFAEFGADHEIWVTTSRRTPPEAEAVLDTFPFAYKLIYSRDRFNPIPAFVSLAKMVYVTAESTGMLSEACTFGSAEVRVLDNLAPGRHKFRRFVEDLRAHGHVDGAKKIDLSAQFARAREILLGPGWGAGE